MDKYLIHFVDFVPSAEVSSKRQRGFIHRRHCGTPIKGVQDRGLGVRCTILKATLQDGFFEQQLLSGGITAVPHRCLLQSQVCQASCLQRCHKPNQSNVKRAAGGAKCRPNQGTSKSAAAALGGSPRTKTVQPQFQQESHGGGTLRQERPLQPPEGKKTQSSQEVQAVQGLPSQRHGLQAKPRTKCQTTKSLSTPMPRFSASQS